MLDFVYKKKYGVYDLVRIVEILRAPGGCPWDIEQTHESTRRNLLEEAYEAAEAIDTGDRGLLLEELGDVLAQVVFHSQIERESGSFDLDDVADGVCRKFIERHPHVFGDLEVSGSGEVLKNWDEIKRSQKGHGTHSQAISSVAKSLPSLWRAEKIQQKARRAGLDWEDCRGALDKLSEEVSELCEAVEKGGNVEEELGDLLFSAVNVSRFIRIDPEEALHRACDKFSARFEYVEKCILEEGGDMESRTLEELDLLWEKAKSAL